MNYDANGPYIVWENYGCEGWQPRSYPTLDAAVRAHSYCIDTVLTKRVAFEVAEKEVPNGPQQNAANDPGASTST